MMLMKRIVWMLFAILFYQSGLAFTTALLAPAANPGTGEGILAVAFPALLAAFFPLNRWAGCGSRACATARRGRTGAACAPIGPGKEAPFRPMPV